MTDYIATDTELTSVADAIRTKGGTAAQLEFPTGFVSAIGAISGSSWKHLEHAAYTVSTTATAAATTGTINCTVADVWTSSKIVYIRIRGRAGKRSGYFVGSDNFFTLSRPANGQTGAQTYGARIIQRVDTSGNYQVYVGATTTGYGVYAYSVASTGAVVIYQRYNSSYSLTIDDTFDVDVFVLDYPDGYPSVYDS